LAGPLPPEIDHVNGSLKVYYTFGIHPRWSSDAVVSHDRLKELASQSCCVGIGEFGLDKTANAATYEEQTRAFKKQAILGVNLKKVLVLHLRSSETCSMKEVIQEALSLLKEVGVKSRHSIHVHCFTGDLDDYRLWLRSFPNTMFGISSRSLSINSLVRGVELHKILLETDSLYLGVTPPPTNPWGLISVAREVAKLRNLPTRVILRISTANGRLLYSLP
jgi:Tat protein secretion system quality control protein TatD with DNase activity